MKIKPKYIKFIVIFLIASTIIFTTLFSGNNVIMKDNGDFERVTRLCSLEKLPDGQFKIELNGSGFFSNILNILFTPSDVRNYPSSQLVVVRLSVAVNYMMNSMGIGPIDNYNVYYLGMMLGLLYALALAFTLCQIDIKNKYINWSVILVSLIILCDIGYIGYFNSLYAEGIQHMFLVALVGFCIIAYKRAFKRSELIICFLVLFLYGVSKLFNVPMAAIIGVLLLLFSLRHISCKRDYIIHGSAFLVSVILMFATLSSMPEWISKETNYNSVFYGVLKDCSDEDARQYLKKDLSLDTDLYELKNTHHYVSNFQSISENYNIEGATDISKLKLVMFYLKHPGITISRVSDITGHSAVIRNIFFMDENYMSDVSRFSLWSKVRENAGFDTVYVNLFVIIFFMVLFSLKISKEKMPLYIKIASPVCILIILAYAFFVPYISNGEADLAKHMFSYIEFIDLVLIYILAVTVIAERKNIIITSVLFAVIFVVAIIPHSHGDVVTMGGYEWYVIDEGSEYKTLISKDIVTTREYHSLEVNNYGKSDIHAWLNGSFLDSFSDAEKAMLYKKDEKIILSVGDVNVATSGNRDFYCSAFPKMVQSNYASAYSQKISGYVFLPSAKHISAMAKNGFSVKCEDKYWLSTPYFNNSQKARYVHPDGMVYFDFVTKEFGIRPLIYVKVK